MSLQFSPCIVKFEVVRSHLQICIFLLKLAVTKLPKDDKKIVFSNVRFIFIVIKKIFKLIHMPDIYNQYAFIKS